MWVVHAPPPPAQLRLLLLLFQSVFYAQVTSSSKIYENNSETENADAQSIKLRKMSDLSKQNEHLIQPYLAKYSALSDIEILKNVLHGYNAA